MVILLMGVSGVGKTTVGRRLAERLRWPFHDADDLHTPVNVEKMRAGLPLDDRDRAPWLARVREVMEEANASGSNAIVACSALKARYRAVLTAGLPDVRLVHLAASAEVLRRRLVTRAGHFMPAGLLETQIRDLEPASDALVLDASEPVDTIVERIVGAL